MDSSLIDGGEVLRFSSNRWNENGWVVIDAASKSCVVIDPGYDGEEITKAVAERGLSVSAVLATHAHFDHIASVELVRSRFGKPPFFVHPEDTKILKTANTYTFFFKADKFEIPVDARPLAGGSLVSYGTRELSTIHAPGHTPGGCLFQAGDALFTGDLLIKTSEELRRLPGFDAVRLADSRRGVFDTFPADTRIHPGHGKPSTLGEVRRFFPELGAGAR